MKYDLKLQGEITKITEIQEGVSKQGKSWKKLGFLITTKGEYPNDIYFSVFGEEKVDNFMKYNKVGQNVEVSFNVTSREYNEKYYTDLRAWKVFTITDANETNEEVLVPDTGYHSANGDSNDLPF